MIFLKNRKGRFLQCKDVSWLIHYCWVASIHFGETIGPIFKIWPVDKVIQKIKFGQELHVPVYCRHIGFTLLLYSH